MRQSGAWLSRFAVLFLLVLVALSQNGCKPGGQQNGQSDSAADALELLNEQLARDSNNVELLLKRAQVLLDRKQVRESFRDLNRAVRLDSLNASLWLLHAEVAFINNRTRMSKESFERVLRLEPNNTDALFRIAELHFYVREYRKALESLDKAQKINENDPRFYFLRGIVYKDAGDTLKAIRSFLSVTDYNPDHYEAWLQLGLLHAERKNPLTIAYYDNALNINPQSLEALYAKAYFFQSIDSIPRAEAIYTQILQIDSIHKDALFNLGFLAYDYHKDYRLATTYFAKAIEYYPTFADAYYMRGLAFEELAEYKKSTRDYLATIQIDRNHKQAFDGIKRIEKK
jgi:tetratricopeptide (TPR) repeat protein